MSYWEDAIPYFTRSELACKAPGYTHDSTEGLRLDLRFAIALPVLRQQWDRPLILTSVCRTPDYNESVGGHVRSLHLTENPVHPVDGTMAGDVWWGDWGQSDQLAFSALAISLGWSVGLNTQFIHVDRRYDFGLSQKVFKYDNWDERFEVTI